MPAWHHEIKITPSPIGLQTPSPANPMFFMYRSNMSRLPRSGERTCPNMPKHTPPLHPTHPKKNLAKISTYRTSNQSKQPRAREAWLSRARTYYAYTTRRYARVASSRMRVRATPSSDTSLGRAHARPRAYENLQHRPLDATNSARYTPSGVPFRPHFPHLPPLAEWVGEPERGASQPAKRGTMDQLLDMRLLHEEALKIILRKHRRPFSCFFCKKRVKPQPARIPAHPSSDEPFVLVAHHIDNHHENLIPSNLAPAHAVCHAEHHRTVEGRDSTRRMIRRANQAKHALSKETA